MSPLCNTKKLQLRQCWLLNEIITSNFNQLDQVIVSERLSQLDCFSTSYLNVTSDHKAIMVWVPNEGNCLSQKFKENFTFDQYNETRSGLKRKATAEDTIPKKKKELKKINPWKRKSTEAREREVLEKNLLSDAKERTFRNLDSHTCWLYSCIQLMLTVFDNIEDISVEGSQLWECFIK